MPLLGAHMSVAGGLHQAFTQLARVEGEAMQIFTRNQRQWQAAPVSDVEATAFLSAWQAAGPIQVAAHNSYLINLASNKKETEQRSVTALIAELARCQKLRIPWLIMHPGSHLGEGTTEGIRRCSRNLDTVLANNDPANQVTILLENTAGQGTNLGSRFEELAEIIAGSHHPERFGICFDTCHAFAAGYDLRSREAYEQTFTVLDRTVGLERLHFFHLNDALKPLGSRVDRHSHIGQGEIGTSGFRLLLNDPRFRRHPMVLETPKGPDLLEDIENLTLLRGLFETGHGPTAPR